MTAVNVDLTTEVDVFGTLTRVKSNIYRMWSEGLLIPTMMETQNGQGGSRKVGKPHNLIVLVNN